MKHYWLVGAKNPLSPHIICHSFDFYCLQGDHFPVLIEFPDFSPTRCRLKTYKKRR